MAFELVMPSALLVVFVESSSLVSASGAASAVAVTLSLVELIFSLVVANALVGHISPKTAAKTKTQKKRLMEYI